MIWGWICAEKVIFADITKSMTNDMPTTYAPFARPLYVMLKPAGALCNLACDYCYYLEKSKLYQDNPKHVMSDELLEKFIREYIGAQTMAQVLFTTAEVCGRPYHRKLHPDQWHDADG